MKQLPQKPLPPKPARRLIFCAVFSRPVTKYMLDRLDNAFDVELREDCVLVSKDDYSVRVNKNLLVEWVE